MTTDRDPGLQPERTRLAWRRTTLSFAAATVLATRTALHEGVSPLGLALSALCCGFWLVFLWMAHHRVRRLASPSRPATLTPRHATAAALCTLAMAVCAVATVL